MWKRVELHNHTVESDGNLKPKELVSFLHEQGIQNFSITDHNTITAWDKAKPYVKKYDMEMIHGFELTSFYGHMLIQNINEYFPWDDIDEDNADKLFEKAHKLGAIAGPAHPFSIPTPFSNGMNWSMKIHDYHLVDFIEIINNAHTMVTDNKNGILFWEDLIFQGYDIAAVSGMDLHRITDISNFYTTYINVHHLNDPLSKQLNDAIKSCQTQVTKGPIINYERNPYTIDITIDNCDNYHYLLLEYRTKDQTKIYQYNKKTISIPIQETDIATIMLYENTIDWKHLLTVIGPIKS